MPKLREILDKYEPWGYSEFDIIKKYFQENSCEQKAIEMLTQFSMETIKNQHTYADTLKEMYSYSNAIMCNIKIDFKVRMRIMTYYHEFLRYGELCESSLKEIGDIIAGLNPGDLQFFPQPFLGYLQSKEIGKQYGDSSGFRLEIIEKKGAL